MLNEMKDEKGDYKAINDYLHKSLNSHYKVKENLIYAQKERKPQIDFIKSMIGVDSRQ
jgi:hypothetical protein